METRRRRRRRPGDGACPNGGETSPLHPRSGRSNHGSIGASGTNAAVATAPHHQPASSTLSGGQFRGVPRGHAGNGNGNAHFHLANVGNQPAAPGRVRGNVMDREMHTDTISAVDSTAPGSTGILFGGAGSENRHTMQAQQAQHECEEETVEFHPEFHQPSLWPDPDTNTSTTMTKPSNSNEEGPVYMDSGLQLTHRTSPLRGTSTTTSIGRGNGKNFELKSNDHVDDNNNNSSHQPPAGRMKFLSLQHQHQRQYHEQRQKRLLAYVRLGVVALCAVLAVGSKVFVSTAFHEHRLMAAAAAAATDTTSAGTNANTNDKVGADGTRQLQNTKMGKAMKPPSLSASAEATNKTSRRRKRHYAEEVVRTLRLEFDAWSKRHSRDYGSAEETERRFGIWMDNHHDTLELNERHGPCQMTGKAVFGDNHFKDLTKEEFAQKFLTGYTGPRAEEVPKHRLHRTDEAMERKLREEIKKARDSSSVVGRRRKSVRPSFHRVKRHPSVQKRYLEFVPVAADAGGISTGKGGYQQTNHHEADPYGGFTIVGCKWYDFSCLFRYVFTGHILGGVREPAYDSDSYPDSVDWRDMGVVTSVHSQGSCGACWAITAVETIESANAIKTGNLIDLSESEVITCDDTCLGCDGGWPQNAFEYAINHNGLPSESDWSYDGDFLLALTYALSGDSANMDQGELSSYLYSQCPNYGGSESQSGSGDEAAYYSAGDAVSYSRFAAIDGYGYATDKCLCYTDGTGCDCDEQNEGLAIRNVASYGPAVVCLDASTWQSYAGGILTTESGCQSGFMDMNHCVQVVGYAFVDEGAAEEGGDEQNNSHGSGSQDESRRSGYWIVRNQWSSSWGMNGYIYVAMGDNTCGILNDMTQAYF